MLFCVLFHVRPLFFFSSLCGGSACRQWQGKKGRGRESKIGKEEDLYAACEVKLCELEREGIGREEK